MQREWSIFSYDFKTAFLYGALKEQIYMEQPPGFQVDGMKRVCCLITRACTGFAKRRTFKTRCCTRRWSGSGSNTWTLTTPCMREKWEEL